MRTLAILLLSVSLACGATVTGIIHDGQGNPITSQPTFTPLFGAYFDGTNTIFPTVVHPRTGTNGDFSTTLATGAWSYLWSGYPVLYGLVPDTNVTVNFWTTVTNMFTNLVAQVSGHVLPGTSVTMVTNNLGTSYESIMLSVTSVLYSTNSGFAGVATNAVYATNSALAALATIAVTATNALNAVTAANATGLTLETNAAPALWTNPVVWMKWTNSTGGIYWSPGYTNGL
jgi:hypothetical protein